MQLLWTHPVVFPDDGTEVPCGRHPSTMCPIPGPRRIVSRGPGWPCEGNITIEAKNLTKRYGAKIAVNNVSFTLKPGRVTGFLGPNGAGKSTTMRMLVGLDRPTSGSITVQGKPYAEHRNPMNLVGALLDAKAVHPGRTARSHLRSLAATHGISDARVLEVLRQTGLEGVAEKRVGRFSLGMGQRLGIAAALLGDPQVLVLDEQVNGLDPDGVVWVRNFVREFASGGRTVLLSSHLISEMAQTADHLLVLGRGQLIADAALAELTEGHASLEDAYFAISRGQVEYAAA